MPGFPTKLSNAEIELICEMRERGCTLAMIQRLLASRGTKISTGAIGWQCLRLGADLPVQRRQPTGRKRPIVMRSGHPVRPFTPDEDRRIIDLEAQGASVAAIARELGRRHHSVTGRIRALALHDSRREEAA